MGTHPIFESDFDCLTELKMNRFPVSVRNLCQSQIRNKIIASRVNAYCNWGDSWKGGGVVVTEDYGQMKIKNKNILNKFESKCKVNGDVFQTLDYGEPIEFDVFLESTGQTSARNITGPNGTPIVVPHLYAKNRLGSRNPWFSQTRNIHKNPKVKTNKHRFENNPQRFTERLAELENKPGYKEFLIKKKRIFIREKIVEDEDDEFATEE